jgi:aldose 1-epimerase
MHPYFNRNHGAALLFEAGGVWINGGDALPARHAEVPREWDHAHEQPIGVARLDNCFTTWNGTARIGGAAANISISAEAVFRHLQIYTPPQGDLFCVEPVSHVPNALHRTGLPPGQASTCCSPANY